jgi:hypothetical protein
MRAIQRIRLIQIGRGVLVPAGQGNGLPDGARDLLPIMTDA